MSKNLLNLLLFILSFALYFLAIKPLYTGVGGVIQPEQSVQKLRMLNAQYDDTLRKAEDLINQADGLKKQYESVTPKDKAEMAVMVPDGIDKVRLLSEAHKIGEEAGFALNDLSYSEGGNPSTGKGYASIAFTVKTTYPRFKALMDNFEKSMRLYSIESVSFNPNGKEDELTSFQVKLQTYYLK